MLRRTPRLDDLDRRHAREVLDARSYAEALAVFAALWRQASSSNSDFPGDWRDDLDADLEIARAINGLPPRA